MEISGRWCFRSSNIPYNSEEYIKKDEIVVSGGRKRNKRHQSTTSSYLDGCPINTQI
jgi:hypothetical protein